MCKWGNHTKVRVRIPADLSCTHQEKWKVCGIDSCIAPIVKALQDAGIDMRGSCCGHDGWDGDIHLQDGRVLVITNRDFLRNQLYWYWGGVVTYLVFVVKRKIRRLILSFLRRIRK